MSNEERRKQMVTEAKAYTAKFYDDGSADSKTKTKTEETFTDFCAGWMAADKSRWIPVEKELPEKEEDNPSLSVNVIVTDGSSAFESYYSFNTHIWAGAEIYGTITHWMPMPVLPRKEDQL